MNQNATAHERGMRFYLSILAADMARSAPEFAITKAQASRRRKELIAAGYRVTILSITSKGGLIAA